MKWRIIANWKSQPKWHDSRQTVSEILGAVQALKEKDEHIVELKHKEDAIKKKLHELQVSNSEQRSLCTSLREQNSDLQQLLRNQSLKDSTETEIEKLSNNSLLNKFLGRFLK